MTPATVITGTSIITGAGLGREPLRDLLWSGQSCIKPTSLFPPGSLACKVSAELGELDAAKFLNPRQVRMLDRPTRAYLTTLLLASREAGLPSPAHSSDRCGMITTSTYSATGNLIRFHREIVVSGPRFINPLYFRNTMYSTQMMLGAINHQLRGINVCVSMGSTAVLDALVHCRRWISAEVATLMAVGGSEALWPGLQQYFEQRDYLATRSPFQPVPYGQGSPGAVLGEASGAIFLESAEVARARNAPVLAEVLGAATRAGEPQSALRRAARHALAQAGVTPADVSLVIGGGNGLVRRDAAEACALAEVFQSHRPWLTSASAGVGDCLSASGFVQVCLALLLGQTGTIPPVPGLGAAIPELTLPVVTGNPVPLSGDLILLTALGEVAGASAALLRVSRQPTG